MPRDPPDTNPLTVPLAYVSMRRVLCVAFLATSCLLSELRKQFRLLPIVFPLQYLNYSPQNLVSNFSFNNFTILEAHLSIATYQYVITTKLEVLFESMDKIWQFEAKFTILKFWTKSFNYSFINKITNEPRLVEWPQERIFFQRAKSEFFSSGILMVSLEVWNWNLYPNIWCLALEFLLSNHRNGKRLNRRIPKVRYFNSRKT